MKDKPKPYASIEVFREPGSLLMIQAPLPDFADTLPILLSVPGQGSGRQGPSPLAPSGQQPKGQLPDDTQ